MTTIVINAKVQPAVTMDKVHFNYFTIKLKQETTPKRVIQLSYTLYGVDGEGESVFDKTANSVSFEDFNMALLVASGKDPATFMVDYAAAKAEVSAEFADPGISDEKLMAYFEIAMGRILEIDGDITISSVE